MIDDQVILVCLPVGTSLDSHARNTNSIKGTCNECEREVWISESMQPIYRELSAILRCFPCGIEKMKEEERNILTNVSPQQIAEMEEGWKSLFL